MTTTVFAGGAAAGDVYSTDVTYSTARSGSSLVARPAAGNAVVGQITGYSVYEGFLEFDTSSIPDTDVVLSVTLEVYLVSDGSTADFEIQARLHDWGSAITTADWVAGASLSGKTLLATLNTNGIGAPDSLKALASDAAFKDNINKTGVTRIILCSKEQVDNSAPTGNEYVILGAASNAPQLTVVHSGITGPLVGGRLVGRGGLAGRLVV